MYTDLDYENGQIFKIIFDKPISVEKDVVYSIKQHREQGQCYYGYQGKKEIEGTGGVLFTFE